MRNRIDASLTQVLWVEDDPLITDEIQEEATNYGLQLAVVDSWDDATEQLEKYFSRWSAIIINPACKLHSGSYPNKPMRLLPQAFSDMSRCFAKNNIVKPWYLLTDMSGEKFMDMVLDSRKEFDGDWGKGFYDHNNPNETTLLLKRIRVHVRKAKALQVRSGKYKEVFDAIKWLEDYNLSANVEDIMEDLMVSVVYDVDSGNQFNQMRKCVEYILDSMGRNEILPQEIYSGPRRELNVTNCRRLLTGKDTKIDNGWTIVPQCTLMNSIMGKNLTNILIACNAGSHAQTNQDRLDLEDYINSVGFKNLQNSLTLQLCDIILWYRKNCEENIGFGNNRNIWQRR